MFSIVWDHGSYFGPEISTPELETACEKLLSIGEERSDLKAKINYSTKNDKPFRLYDGFESSGRIHVAHGMLKAMNANETTTLGGVFAFWVEDWFALMNDKMGGDLDKIKIVGKCLIEAWKAASMKGLFKDVVCFVGKW